MKKLLLAVFLLITAVAGAQSYRNDTATYGIYENRIKVKNALALPKKWLQLNTTDTSAQIFITPNGAPYAYTGGNSGQYLPFVMNGQADTFYLGATFDTTTRVLSLERQSGGVTNVLIPRGGSVTGISSLTSSRTGNIVTLTGDNGSTVQYSVRDADSATQGTITQITTGYGVTGGTITSTGTIAADTTVLATKAWATFDHILAQGNMSGRDFTAGTANASFVQVNGTNLTYRLYVNGISLFDNDVSINGTTRTTNLTIQDSQYIRNTNQVDSLGIIFLDATNLVVRRADNTATLFAVYYTGDADLQNDLTANKFIKRGGTGSQILLADGSVIDTTTFLGSYVKTVSVAAANGITGTSSGGQNPLLTIALGDITPTSVSATGAISATTLAGTIQTAAQPNITSLGVLTVLTSTGNITTSAQVNSSTVSGTVVTAAQPNITSLGTLTILTSTGNITTSAQVNSSTVSGTIVTAAQPNITSLGILTILTSTGNITTSSTLSADNIIITGVGELIKRTGASTSLMYLDFLNTGGGIYVGTEGSSGGQIITGNPAYYGAVAGVAGLGLSGDGGATLHQKITNTGVVTFYSTIQTAAPPAFTAKPWLLGDYTAGSITPSGYISVEVNGQVYLLQAQLYIPTNPKP